MIHYLSGFFQRKLSQIREISPSGPAPQTQALYTLGKPLPWAAQKELAGTGEKGYNEGDKYCGGYGAQMGCVKITGLKGAQNELF